MISTEYAIDYIQDQLFRLGLIDTPENPEFILVILNEKIKEFIGSGAVIQSYAEITTDGSTEYTLPDKVYDVKEVQLDDYQINSKITENDVKKIAGDVL